MHALRFALSLAVLDRCPDEEKEGTCHGEVGTDEGGGGKTGGAT